MAASLAQKLQLRSSQQLGVLNVPEGYLAKLKADLAGIPVSSPAKGKSDAVLAFVNNLAEAQKLFPRAISAVKSDGLLWIAYPKGGSKMKTDVNRDRLWEAVSKTGWRPVRLVAIDDVWSAMRFRPADLVGK
jgi:hypothetical protein